MERLNIKQFILDKRMLFAFCIGLICCSLCVIALWFSQLIFFTIKEGKDISYIYNKKNTEDSSEQSPIDQTILQTIDSGRQDIITYFEQNNIKAKTLSYLIKNDNSFDFTEENLQRLTKTIGCKNIIILNKSGDILNYAYHTTRNYRLNIYNRLRLVYEDPNATAVPFSVEHNGDNVYYYASKIDNEREVVIEVDDKPIDDLYEKTISWDRAVEGIKNNEDYEIFVVSSLNYSYIYPENDEFKNLDAISSGLHIDVLKDDTFTFFTINDKLYFGGVKFISDQNVYFIIAIPTEKISMNILQSVNPSVIASIFLILLMISYSIFIRREKDFCKDEERIVKLKSSWQRLGLLTLSGILLISLFIGFYDLLINQYEHADSDSVMADKIVKILNENEERLSDYESEYRDNYLIKAQIARRTITNNPSLINIKSLSELSKAIGVHNIEIFDENGNEILSNSNITGLVINKKKNNRYKDFARLLQGVDHYIQEPLNNELTGETDQKIGVSLKNSEGKISGVLIITVLPSKVRKSLTSLQFKNTLKGFNASDNYLLAIKKDNHEIVYATDESIVGNKATEVGITKSRIRNNYMGYVNIYGTKYYGKCSMTNNYAIFYLTEANSNINQFSTLSLTSAVILFFILFVILYPALYFKVIKKEAQEGLSLSIIKSDTVPAEKRLSEFFEWIYMSIGILLILSLTLAKEKVPIINYIVSNNWENGVNFIAITNCVIIVICIITVEQIVKAVFKYLASNMNSRNATICRLLRSLTKYAALITAVYMCLTELGVKPGTLLASAGIMSLAISFGAQSLMADILAGLFIIFEGNCKVGDIVFDSTGFRGLVTDIGLRTSKLKDDNFNVKIINNSDLRNIINATNLLSLATCDVTLHSYVDYNLVENAIRTEMESFKDRIPQIVRMDYRNITAVDPNFITIRVCAFCHEKDRLPLERALFKELRLVFEKYDLIATYSNIMIVDENLNNVITK